MRSKWSEWINDPQPYRGFVLYNNLVLHDERFYIEHDKIQAEEALDTINFMLLDALINPTSNVTLFIQKYLT